MNKVLLYVGVNKGYGLATLLSSKQFDVAYGFEPDPELFSMVESMFKPYPFIKLINAACSNDDTVSELFITKNRCSTSLAKPDTKLFDSGCGEGIDILKTIQVKTINLLNFIEENNIQFIDHIVLDTQGNDYNILKTLEPLIKNKKIKTIFTETHKDGCFLYPGMDNQFNRFKELLSENYEISYFSADDKIISKDKNPEEYVTVNEWDTCWELKKEII